MAAAANGSTSALRADAVTRRWAVLGVCQGRGGTTWGQRRRVAGAGGAMVSSQSN